MAWIYHWETTRWFVQRGTWGAEVSRAAGFGDCGHGQAAPWKRRPPCRSWQKLSQLSLSRYEKVRLWERIYSCVVVLGTTILWSACLGHCQHSCFEVPHWISSTLFNWRVLKILLEQFGTYIQKIMDKPALEYTLTTSASEGKPSPLCLSILPQNRVLLGVVNCHFSVLFCPYFSAVADRFEFRVFGYTDGFVLHG